ncbi:hypothetical protein E8E13_007567 [Curvularia kusanoi]|uniref:Uncharacterized protein n=1 Tax=Curvularia kusanoi TaxID=90978 RepID=A0A9P4W6B1_CURKU|nr:hypothetical protein E8E13_007567 [Curvularia kusanoi]
MNSIRTTTSRTADSSSKIGMKTGLTAHIEGQEVAEPSITGKVARPSKDSVEPTVFPQLETGSPAAPRYLVLSIPEADGRKIIQLELPKDLPGGYDSEILKRLKEAYKCNRPALGRYLNLRGVSEIQITRFELAHTMMSILPLAMEWKWPAAENLEWEWDRNDVETSNHVMNSMLMHLWTSNCSPKPTISNNAGPRQQRWPDIKIRFGKQEESLTDIFPTSVAPMPWLRDIVSIEIGFPDRSPSEGIPSTFNVPDDPPSWLRDATLTLTYESATVEPKFVYSRMPKKLKTKMAPDPNGIRGPIGWAIWVEEDFVVPWWLPLVFLIVALGAFLFAITYTATHGPKANGWTISTGLLSIITFVFTAWVLWTKDSKHGR